MAFDVDGEGGCFHSFLDLRIKAVAGILFIHQPVQILAHALEINQSAALLVSFAPQHNGFHHAFLDQVVKGSALDAEQSLHILPPPKLRHDIGAVSSDDWLGGESVFFHFFEVASDACDVCLWFHGVDV